MVGRVPSKRKLSGCRVLVVEDDYFIATEVQDSLTALGCEIVGPFSSIEEPIQVIADYPPDAAVLDVNVAGRAIYPLAADFLKRKIPILFVTGYDLRNINPKFRSIPHLGKPISPRRLQNAVIKMILEPRPAAPAAQSLDDSLPVLTVKRSRPLS